MENTKNSKLSEESRNSHRKVMPADCGQDFQWNSSSQSPAIAGKSNTETVMVSLADSTDDCTGIRTGNDAKLRERESANDTHHAHSKMTGSRPGMSFNQNFVFGVH